MSRVSQARTQARGQAGNPPGGQVTRFRFIYSGHSIFEFEYLRRFEIELENILGYTSGAQRGLSEGKNLRSKIFCYSLFKECGEERMLELFRRSIVVDPDPVESGPFCRTGTGIVSSRSESNSDKLLL
jgi:hypothetical protein